MTDKPRTEINEKINEARDAIEEAAEIDSETDVLSPAERENVNYPALLNQ